MVDRLDPDATFYFHLIASGGIALVSGYASGLRLNVGALLIICIFSGVAVFLAGIMLGVSPLVSTIIAMVAMALQQLGYFAAVLTRAAVSHTVSSEKDAIDARAQGTVNPGKRSSS